jgi:hypothetical protein
MGWCFTEIVDQTVSVGVGVFLRRDVDEALAGSGKILPAVWWVYYCWCCVCQRFRRHRTFLPCFKKHEGKTPMEWLTENLRADP